MRVNSAVGRAVPQSGHSWVSSAAGNPPGADSQSLLQDGHSSRTYVSSMVPFNGPNG